MDAVAGPMLRQMKQLGVNAKFMGGDGSAPQSLSSLLVKAWLTIRWSGARPEVSDGAGVAKLNAFRMGSAEMGLDVQLMHPTPMMR